MNKKNGVVGKTTPERHGQGTMSESKYTGGRNKSRLKLAHLRTKPQARLRLGGMEPSDDMQPGEYKISCEGASKKSFAGGLRIELKYRVIDGPHTGTALRQWITVDASGVISPKSRYASQCAVALGRPLDSSDNPDDPASIFSGRVFQAFVGFRKTDKARGGTPTPENALRHKDGSDGLRVHDLLAREEL
jgi:hypothetical protein